MTAFDRLAERLEMAGVPFHRDAQLAPLTWLGVGGRTPMLLEPRGAEDLDLLHRAAANLEVPLRRLGSGANLLIADAMMPFAVVRLSAPAFQQVDMSEGRVTAGAGIGLEPLIRKTLAAGLQGLEGLVGIPASLGGALAMNAGGKQGEVSDHLAAVTVADAAGTRRLDKAACGFAYRKSGLKDLTVVSAEFALSPGDPEALREKARGIKDAKRATQPLEDASAGCIFQNPPGDSAGRLIEAAGLKGAMEGGAQVSPLHANFIVNLGGATADDIERLIDRVRDGVRRAQGAVLELEVVRWP